MEGLVVGSHDRDQLIIICNHQSFKEKASEHANRQECGICGDEVGVTADGELFVACNDCEFPVCRPCYDYERVEGEQVCPRCKTRYARLRGCARVVGDDEEDDADDLDNEFGFTTSQQQMGRVEWRRRLEKWKSRQMEKLENGGKEMDGGSEGGDTKLIDEERLPLSRKVAISRTRLSPYRMIIAIRFVVLVFFFHYRILHPVSDAYGVWLVSVMCEIWFGISWILDQFPKWFPVNRETYLDRLSLRYEKEGEFSQLPSIDIFVTTSDSSKEPPLITANTILSILALDYPVDKLTCYISDDGASILTFQALSDTHKFARKWVPFCKKFKIEPRAPEWYFNEKVDYLKDKVSPEFIKERRAMKREYEEFKVGMNALVAKAQKVSDEEWKMEDGTPWPGNDVNDHPGMIQMFLGQNGDTDGNDLPRLVYVSREKRPGFDHHMKAGATNALLRVSAIVSNAPYILNLDCDHYINNSKALREAMCFMMDDSIGKRICFVQFPLLLDGADEYASRNTVFFDINMKGMDGIQGPIYMGSGCVFRRIALYGFGAPKSKKFVGRWCDWWPHSRRNKKNPPKTIEVEDEEGSEGLNSEISKMKLGHKLGNSPLFIASTLNEGGGTTCHQSEAIHVIGCGYEDKTDWGKEVGWIYGPTTENMLTGFKMHCRGWRSVYCSPSRSAFRGPAPSNQELLGACGSVEIFFSRHCPLWCGYGRGLKFLERLAYINATVYPFASIAILSYCVLPVICLIIHKFIIPEVNNVGSMLFVSVFICIFATCLLEMRWSGVSFREWWKNQQASVINGVSAHLFAVFHGLLNSAAGIDTDLTRSIAVLIPPTTIFTLNLIGIVAGFSSAFSNGYDSLGPLLGRLFFAFWVIANLYPFVRRRLFGFRGGAPTIVVVWCLLVACVFSFLWLRIDPFLPAIDGPALEDCGLDCDF